MKIIIDTNIVFSAILNTNGKIADLILNSSFVFYYYSPTLLRLEIEEHKEKIKQISGYSDTELSQLISYLFERIKFISEEQIPFEFWQSSISFVRDVDMDDIAFVALTQYIKGLLWTGDKILYEGIKAKGFTSVVNTNELLEIRNMNE